MNEAGFYCFEEEPEDSGYLYCTLCDGLLEFMGCLGKLNWFRCRHCGMEFSEKGANQ